MRINAEIAIDYLIEKSTPEELLFIKQNNLMDELQEKVDLAEFFLSEQD